MRRSLIFLVSLLAVGCGASKHQPTVIVRDSIRVEYRDRIVRDTAYFPIPAEVEKIVTRDTSSRLENSVAVSEAVVSDGYLSHTLRTKKQTIAVPVEIEVHDTTYIHIGSQETTQYVEVEKPLNGWQKFRLGAFWWLVCAVVLLLIWTFRKLIFKVII